MNKKTVPDEKNNNKLDANKNVTAPDQAISAASNLENSLIDQSIEKYLEDNPSIGELVKEDPELQEKLSLSIKTNHFSGPLPPPDLLKHYDEIQNGFAERIIKMAEQDAEHTRDMQRRILEAKKSEVSLGQIFGFLIGVIALICGTVAAINDQPVVGALIGSGGVLGLVSIFIYGRAKEEKETKEENKEIKQGKKKKKGKKGRKGKN